MSTARLPQPSPASHHLDWATLAVRRDLRPLTSEQLREREIKGTELALAGAVARHSKGFTVGGSRGRVYLVRQTPAGLSCECADFVNRAHFPQDLCKHAFAALAFGRIEREREAAEKGLCAACQQPLTATPLDGRHCANDSCRSFARWLFAAPCFCCRSVRAWCSC